MVLAIISHRRSAVNRLCGPIFIENGPASFNKTLTINWKYL
jgi:hypothetical protein